MPSTLENLLLLALLIFGQTSAHTWNEQLALIDNNGKYTGPLGYSRGYVGRTDPGYNGYSMLHLLPPLESGRTRIDPRDLLCHPAQRTTHNQTANYPRLRVAPGSTVAMKYLENGHVTLPENQPGKPPKAGTAFVYGTTSPMEAEKMSTVLLWTRNGKGGDGRGRLLAANNFDDGRCHQINSGPLSMERQQLDPDPYPDQPTSITEQWCETDVILPNDLKVGKLLTIYWVWQWPTAPGAPGLPDGKDEYYTTCSDFDVVAKEPDGPITNTLAIQDPQTAAVSDYQHRPAITQTPNLMFDPIGSHKHKVAVAALSQNAASAMIPTATPIPTAAPAPTFSSMPTAGVPPASSIPPLPMASYASISVPPLPLPSSTPLLSSTPPLEADPTLITLTALVTVIATLAPTQSMLIVQGSHVVTFTNPQVTLAPRAAVGPASVHRRRAAVRMV